jgi:hypothetical protein
VFFISLAFKPTIFIFIATFFQNREKRNNKTLLKYCFFPPKKIKFLFLFSISLEKKKGLKNEYFFTNSLFLRGKNHQMLPQFAHNMKVCLRFSIFHISNIAKFG